MTKGSLPAEDEAGMEGRIWLPRRWTSPPHAPQSHPPPTRHAAKGAVGDAQAARHLAAGAVLNIDVAQHALGCMGRGGGWEG